MTIDGAGKSVSGISLILKDVNLFTTGLYGCEASAEGSFHTDLVRKFMTVVGELPFLNYCINVSEPELWTVFQ